MLSAASLIFSIRPRANSVGGRADAPEIGPVADAASMYDAVRRMRIAPVGVRSLLGIRIPIALPFLVVVGLQVPLKELLRDLLKALA